MKSVILFCLSLGWTFFTFSQDKKFSVTGYLPEAYTGKEIMISGTDSFETVCSGTQFSLNGMVRRPKLFRLIFPGYVCKGIIHPAFYLENTDIQLQFGLSKAGYGCYTLTKVTGSATHTQIASIMKSIRELHDDSAAIKKQIDQFITDYQHNLYGPELIKRYGKYFGKEWTVQNFQKLDTLLQHQYGHSIDAIIRQLTVLQPGRLMPDFEQPGMNGKPFRLSSLYGKTVLIDFWASWCIPCRKEIPDLVKLYKQYKSKGFEIVSVSLDNEAAKWKQAVQEEHLEWIQVSDLKGWENDLAEKYAVSSIPYNILFNSKGEVIQTNLSARELSIQLEKL